MTEGHSSVKTKHIKQTTLDQLYQAGIERKGAHGTFADLPPCHSHAKAWFTGSFPCIPAGTEYSAAPPQWCIRSLLLLTAAAMVPLTNDDLPHSHPSKRSNPFKCLT